MLALHFLYIMGSVDYHSYIPIMGKKWEASYSLSSFRYLIDVVSRVDGSYRINGESLEIAGFHSAFFEM